VVGGSNRPLGRFRSTAMHGQNQITSIPVARARGQQHLHFFRGNRSRVISFITYCVAIAYSNDARLPPGLCTTTHPRKQWQISQTSRPRRSSIPSGLKCEAVTANCGGEGSTCWALNSQSSLEICSRQRHIDPIPEVTASVSRGRQSPRLRTEPAPASQFCSEQLLPDSSARREALTLPSPEDRSHSVSVAWLRAGFRSIPSPPRRQSS